MNSKQILKNALSQRPDLEPYLNDIDFESARMAYYGTSFSPENRAAQTQIDYAIALLNDFEEVKKEIMQGKKRGITVLENADSLMNDWCDEHKDGLKKVFNHWINAKSNCISSMITGPANFPTSRAKRANTREHDAYCRISEYRNKSIQRFLKQVMPYGQTGAILSNDPEAVKKLNDKIANLQRERDLMKEANKIVRKHFKNGKSINDDARAQCLKQLEELGLSKNAQLLIEPKWAGRVVAFEPYQLQGIGTKIKSAKARLAELELTSNALIDDNFKNGVMAEISDDSKIVIYFASIPDESVRDVLKKNAFKWSRPRGAWVRKMTKNALAAYKGSVRPVLAEISLF